MGPLKELSDEHTGSNAEVWAGRRGAQKKCRNMRMKKNRNFLLWWKNLSILKSMHKDYSKIYCQWHEKGQLRKNKLPAGKTCSASQKSHIFLNRKRMGKTSWKASKRLIPNRFLRYRAFNQEAEKQKYPIFSWLGLGPYSPWLGAITAKAIGKHEELFSSYRTDGDSGFTALLVPTWHGHGVFTLKHATPLQLIPSKILFWITSVSLDKETAGESSEVTTYRLPAQSSPIYTQLGGNPCPQA